MHQNDDSNSPKLEEAQQPTRRSLFAPVAVSAAAAALASPSELMATAGVPSITIPKEITDTINEPTRMGSFEGNGIVGAQVFANACKAENLAALFCCPGNYDIINAIAATGIPAYGDAAKARWHRLRTASTA